MLLLTVKLFDVVWLTYIVIGLWFRLTECVGWWFVFVIVICYIDCKFELLGILCGFDLFSITGCVGVICCVFVVC